MNQSTLFRVVIALGAPGLAILLQLAVRPVLAEGSFTFTPLLAAVIFVGWYAGLLAAFTSLLLSLPAAVYFLVSDGFTLGIDDPGNRVELFIYFVLGSACALLGEHVYRQRRRTEIAARAALDSEARERERATLLETVLDTSPTPIWTALDRHCEHVVGNAAADTLLGVSRGGKASLSREPLFHFRRDGKDVPTGMLPLQRAARDGVHVRAEEFEIIRGDDSRGWLLMNASPLIEGGVPRGAIAVGVDITDRKRGEQQLADDLSSMTLLQQVGNTCARPGSRLEECLQEVLDAAIGISGAAKGAVQLVDPSSGTLQIRAQRGFAQPFLDAFAKVAPGDAVASGEAMKTGQRVVVSDISRSELFAGRPARQVLLDEGVRALQSTPLVGSDGLVLGMISTHFAHPHVPDDRVLRLLDLLARQGADYVERTHAEHALLQSESDARLLQSIGHELILQDDVEAIYQKVVYAASALMRADCATIQLVEAGADGREQLKLLASLGFTPEAARAWEVVASDSRSTFGVSVRTRERVVVRDVTALDYAAGREDEDAFRQAGIRAVQTTPLVSRDARVIGMLSTHWRHPHEPTAAEQRNLDILARLVADFIEHRRSEQALRDADRRKDEFLATLAHELRNPLAPVRTGVQLLRMSGADQDVQRRVTAMIDRQVTHMVRLVDDLLEVSRIGRGKIELRKGLVDMSAVVRSALETAAGTIEGAGHQMAVSLPAEPAWIQADPVRLAQVVGNLLNNAAKYTEPGGTITVSCTRHGKDVVLSVRDTGAGISAEMLPRVFDLFTQVDSTVGRAQGGLGIGLALVKYLVEMHGGSVEARSEGPGRGSEFIVRLPLAAPGARPGAEVRGAPHLTAAALGRRVMVVDDNHDAADSLAMLLKLMGAEVRTTYDGPSALAEMRSWLPSVVFLDLGMPGMDGYATAAQVRSDPQIQDVTLVAVTGWGQYEDRRRTKAVGFDAHLVKPVASDSLVELLGSVPAHRLRG